MEDTTVPAPAFGTPPAKRQRLTCEQTRSASGGTNLHLDRHSDNESDANSVSGFEHSVGFCDDLLGYQERGFDFGGRDFGPENFSPGYFSPYSSCQSLATQDFDEEDDDFEEELEEEVDATDSQEEEAGKKKEEEEEKKASRLKPAPPPPSLGLAGGGVLRLEAPEEQFYEPESMHELLLRSRIVFPVAVRGCRLRSYLSELRDVRSLGVVARSAFRGFGSLARSFPNLEVLRIDGDREGCYNLTSLCMLKNLRQLELQLSMEVLSSINQGGVTALTPLAKSLEVLCVGHFRENYATDLKALEQFTELRVLSYAGQNEPDWPEEADEKQSDHRQHACRVLDLSKLTLLKQLTFERTAFGLPPGVEGRGDTPIATPDRDDDESDDGQPDPDLFVCPIRQPQGLILPPQLRQVTFRHCYGSRITPQLRTHLRCTGCELIEYVMEIRAVRTNNSWVDWVQRSGEEIEAAEHTEEKRRRTRSRRWRREAAARVMPGLALSTDHDLQVGEQVFVFEQALRGFTRGIVAELPGQHRVTVDRGQADHPPDLLTCHRDFVFRMPPMPLEEQLLPTGGQVWRPEPRRKRSPVPPSTVQLLPGSASRKCAVCSKWLKTDEGCRQHMRAVHGIH